MLLQVVRLSNLVAAVIDALMAYTFLTPSLHSNIPPEFKKVVNFRSQEIILLLVWLNTINGLVRLHAAIWPHDKSAYRLMCWTWIVELVWWGFQVYTKKISLQDAGIYLGFFAGILLLSTLSYRSAMRPSNKVKSQ